MVINLSWCAGDYDRKVYHAKAALMHLDKPEMELSITPYFRQQKMGKRGCCE
jgi:hypothetical protein